MFALYVREKKKATFVIEILPAVKSSIHIPKTLLRLKNWEAVTTIIDGVRSFMCGS